jgi:LPXTG-motif cell wall-anchored protein
MNKAIGLILVIIIGPLLFTGVGEAVMSLPGIGACLAAFAGYILVRRK